MLKWNDPLKTCDHDYNDEVGLGERFSQSTAWRIISPECEAHTKKQFDADDIDDPVMKGRKDNAYTLDIGADGFP